MAQRALGRVGLLALQLVGLNAYAWQQRQALAAKRQAMNALLLSAHPTCARCWTRRPRWSAKPSACAPPPAGLARLIWNRCSPQPPGPGPMAKAR
jgi:hypothetical protein